jgi:hypothetical protein
MKRRELTELLAYRDGDDDSLSRERRAELAADPDVPAKLARLAGVTHALRSLPQHPPDAMVWAMVDAHLNGSPQTGRVPRYRCYWPALAAGVCAIALGASLLSMRVDHSDESSVADLIDTSQLLERAWLARHHPDLDSSVVHSALLYRIASVDSQLNQMSADGRATQADVRALWRKRVTLLQSLLDVEQGERVQYTTL